MLTELDEQHKTLNSAHQSIMRSAQEQAEELTKDNDVCTLTMCVNYGGRAEIADAAQAIAREVAAGRLKPDRINEKTFARYLDEPEIPEVDLFVRSSGEQRFMSSSATSTTSTGK